MGTAWIFFNPTGPLADAQSPIGIGPAPVVPGPFWERIADPASVGFDPSKLAEATEWCKPTGAAAVVVTHGGRILIEWGFTSRIYPCHSVRKSLLSALMGRAIAERRIDPNAVLAALGIDDRTPLTEAEKQATVRHLMQARSGVYLRSNAASGDMLKGLPARGSQPPGQNWYYNNWDFNALGTIYEQLTGRTVFQAFTDEIAKPLGFQDFDAALHTRRGDTTESDHPSYEFWLSARDMARFGLLVLRSGDWGGKPIVSREWVAESTQPHTVFPDGNGGYGFMWWIETLRKRLPKHDALLAGSFSAEGMGGHLILIIPKADLVIVVRTNTWLPAGIPLARTRIDGEKLLRFLSALLSARL
jgi:CubicO group peptidase (beta-lactamase class C family)